MNQNRYYTAKEAAKALAISTSTLYAYVSRGLIRSEELGGTKRKRGYLREDIDKLIARKEARRNPGKVVENALHWGTPLLDSAITLIADGNLYYRGQSALDLAKHTTFEQVATLLWTDDLSPNPPSFFNAGPKALSLALQTTLADLTTLSPFERFQVVLPLAATQDVAAYDLRPNAVPHTGGRILQLLTLIATSAPQIDQTMPHTLAQHWATDNPAATPLLNAALILCADHELNASSFTARCVASAGSPPYAVVIAGLSALQGVKHGGYTERVEAFFREVQQPDQARTILASRLKRGESIPGFGHPLYANGDPRSQLLLTLIEQHAPQSPALKLAHAIAHETFDLIAEHPTIDFALVTLALVLNLPPGAPLALFALGRTVGWLGHAIEQYQTDRIIRPRARYVGRQPD